MHKGFPNWGTDSDEASAEENWLGPDNDDSTYHFGKWKTGTIVAVLEREGDKTVHLGNFEIPGEKQSSPCVRNQWEKEQKKNLSRKDATRSQICKSFH